MTTSEYTQRKMQAYLSRISQILAAKFGLKGVHTPY